MTSGTFGRIAALAAATGMRSFSGPAVLAAQFGGPIARIVPVMAAAELAADKTPYVGSRLDPAPLTGRIVMGALVGGLVARQGGASPGFGALLGAAVAFAAAHVGYQARTRAPINSAVAGIAEDCIVAGLCATAISSGR